MLLFSYNLAARRGKIFRAKKSDIDIKNQKIRRWTRKEKDVILSLTGRLSENGFVARSSESFEGKATRPKRT